MEWMVQVLQLMWQGVENQGSSLQWKARLLSRRAHRNQRLLYGWVSRFQQLSFPCTAILNINSILNKACSFLWCGANVNIPSLISKSNTTQCKIWSAVVISANIDYKRYASNIAMKICTMQFWTVPNIRVYWILNIRIESQKHPEHMLLLWVWKSHEVQERKLGWAIRLAVDSYKHYFKHLLRHFVLCPLSFGTQTKGGSWAIRLAIVSSQTLF